MTWLWFALVLLIIVVAGVAFIALRRRRGRHQSPYERRAHLLTAAERSLFGVLQQAMGREYLIFAKIRVADLLAVRRGQDEFQDHLNRIIAKHVDFVLCNNDDIAPVLAIELDDSSHVQARRQERDIFVDHAFRGAGLPLLRITAARAYDAQLIREQIRLRLNDPVEI